MTREAFENAITVRDGVRRLDERGAAPAGDRRRGRRRPRAGRLRPDQPADAAHRRPAPGGAVRHGRPRPRRRRAGVDEGAAGRGAAARRRDDGDGQDGRGEPVGAVAAGRGRRRRAAARRADPSVRRDRDPARVARARRVGGQDRRDGGEDVHGRRARVRLGGGGVRGGHRRGDRGRRRHRDPVRGAARAARGCARCWR